MNRNKRFRNLCALTAFAALCGMAATPVLAHPGHDHGKKTTASTKKAAVMYECQHCKEPMTLAQAKKQNMVCCGMKMVKVTPTKAASKSKKS